MTKITPRSVCRVHCQVQAGNDFSEEVFASAFAKFQRHIRNKYGSTNWKMEVSENGSLDGVVPFYIETAAGTVDTFNRSTAAEFRR